MTLPAATSSRTLLPADWWISLVLVNAPAVALALAPAPLGLLGLAAAIAGNALVVRRLLAMCHELDRRQDSGRRHGAQLAALVDAAADAILTCDEPGVIREANHAAGRLFGHRRDDLIGQPLAMLLPATALETVQTNQYRVLGAAAIEGHRSDGTTFPVSVAISKVRLEGEGLYVVIIHDQSDLHKARREVESASRAKSAFLLAISHELRTPLNGILAVADLLAATRLDRQQLELVQTLVGSGEAMLAAVEQVLDYSRLETGQLRLENELFSPRAVFAEVEQGLAARATAKGLGFSVLADVPARLRGDGRRLRQIIECLADHAIGSTTAGEILVRATAEAGTLVLSVRDTGPGLPPGQAPGLDQAEPAGGIGLGPSIAARLARLMGGRIGMESVPGQGTTYRVWLPFGLPGDDVPTGRAALVALPDAAERATVETLLRDLGLEPIGVPTGRAALAEILRGVVQGQPFGLVVLDEAMSDMGVEDWIRQVGECSGWSGPVVLLRDGAGAGYCPAGIAAAIARGEVGGRLGDWVRVRFAEGRPRV